MNDIKQFHGTWEYFSGGSLSLDTIEGSLKSFTIRNFDGSVVSLDLNTESAVFDIESGILTVKDPNLGDWKLQVIDEDSLIPEIIIVHGKFKMTGSKIEDQIRRL